MSPENEILSEEIDTLRQLRDELRVQAKLGQAELRDRFEASEKKWHRLEGNFRVLRDELSGDADAVGDAAKLLVEEIRASYEHIRRRL